MKPKVLVVGYSPNPRDSGGVPIGMILVDKAESPRKILKSRFLNDWRQFQSQCPRADIDILKGIADEINDYCACGCNADSLLKTIEESFTNSLRVLSEQEIAAADLDSSFEAVADRWGLTRDL